ncbi:MAG: potassium/proton antiporter, partial [Moraxellaceae bacterium]
APVAHALGTIALAMILYDGGLQTQTAAVRRVWKPAALLATFGVLLTAVITGLVAFHILDLPLPECLLLGAIVGSTDAAAVFSLLRSAGIHINERLKSVLEVESASNDPMAIFLTVGLLEVLVNGLTPGAGLAMLFVQQMGIGALVGAGVGWASLRLINGVHLNVPGLYPVLVAACGLFSFGLAANLGGSGFLSVFLTGVVVGNSRFVFQRGTFLFHDGLAWLSQIMMFVVLGLLVNPLALLQVWKEGLAIALALVFLARPLAVVPLLLPFGFRLRELTLLSWGGLRGSVPIILAIFPLLFGLPGAPLIFNVVFFVVLVSAILQGATLHALARRLGLIEPSPATPAATLEITSLGDVDADIVEYTVGAASRAVGWRLSQLALPEGVVVAMITRGKQVIPPRGSTALQAGDHLFVVLQPAARPFVDRVFAGAEAATGASLPGVLSLKGMTRVGEIAHSYGLVLGPDAALSLQEVLRRGLGDEGLQVGAVLALPGAELRIVDMLESRVTTVAVSPATPRDASGQS